MNPRLVTFLYLLLRDQLPSGEVEKMMKAVDETSAFGGTPVYSDPFIRGKAEEIARRLM